MSYSTLVSTGFNAFLPTQLPCNRMQLLLEIPLQKCILTNITLIKYHDEFRQIKITIKIIHRKNGKKKRNKYFHAKLMFQR